MRRRSENKEGEVGEEYAEDQAMKKMKRINIKKDKSDDDYKDDKDYG